MVKVKIEMDATTSITLTRMSDAMAVVAMIMLVGLIVFKLIKGL